MRWLEWVLLFHKWCPYKKEDVYTHMHMPTHKSTWRHAHKKDIIGWWRQWLTNQEMPKSPSSCQNLGNRDRITMSYRSQNQLPDNLHLKLLGTATLTFCAASKECSSNYTGALWTNWHFPLWRIHTSWEFHLAQWHSLCSHLFCTCSQQIS